MITAQLEAIEQAMGEPDFAASAAGAHRARNETLLIGARELGEALRSVEVAARAGRASDAARQLRRHDAVAGDP